ncbi:Ankyrin repeat domain-containing protein 50 [Leucoagaricus sp. SymC.cos]|nr:Ankyrin repeat domain-containing protein 50 [Leucoagaricus sp. SymC.cos]
MASPPSLPNRYDLHFAALNGDDEAVIQALEMAADVNSLDEEGRTPIMCAVAGDRWQEIDASDASFMAPKRLNAIRIMLRHPQISLHCLNAPHAAANGVIPLSMAAWLNFPQLVELLLEESADTVAVDGLDAHGATALMYAARDNSLQVVQLLLSHGARPDLRDCNFRSSIQYAIPHPQILWLCESVLRRHRWRESQSTGAVKLSINACSESTVEGLLSLAHCSLPTFAKTSPTALFDPPPQSVFVSAPLARSVKTLISTLSNPPDIPFLRSLLFAPALPTNSHPSLYPLSVPILVNRPDERGWSVIHHACSFTIFGSSPSKSSSPEGRIPEIEVLDILYLAGADVSLFSTEEHYTPLHILAKTSGSVPSTISSVVKEQIRDFVTHLVRDLGAPLGARDKNDETCLHLAVEYGAHKVVLDILLDFDHVFNEGRISKMKNSRGLLAADLAVKPELLDSFTAMKEKMDMTTIRRGSISSAFSDNTLRGSEKHVSLTAVVVDEFGVPQPLATEEGGDADVSDPLNIDPTEKTHVLLTYMRSTVPTQFTLDQMEVTADILVKYFLAKIAAAKQEVDNAKRGRETVRANARALGASLYAQSRAKTATMTVTKKVKKEKKWKHRQSEDSQMTRVSFSSASGSEVDVSYVSVGTQTAVGIERGEFATIKAHHHGQGQSWTDWFDGGTVRKKRDKKRVEWEGLTSVSLALLEEENDGQISSQTMVIQQQSALFLAEHAERQGEWTIGKALRTAPVVLGAVRKDLERIEMYLINAEEYLKGAEAGVERVGRILKRALKKRRAIMGELAHPRASAPTPLTSRSTTSFSPENSPTSPCSPVSPGYLGYALQLSVRPSYASISSIASDCSIFTNSSNLTVMTGHSHTNGSSPGDDDETRSMRRLLLRRIEAQLRGAYEEVDKVVTWISVVQDVVSGVKRRTYL